MSLIKEEDESEQDEAKIITQIDHTLGIERNVQLDKILLRLEDKVPGETLNKIYAIIGSYLYG